MMSGASRTEREKGQIDRIGGRVEERLLAYCLAMMLIYYIRLVKAMYVLCDEREYI